MDKNFLDDDELVILIKNSAQENQFYKISTEDIERIYNLGVTLAKSKLNDFDLDRAVNQFKVELEKRRSSISSMPSDESKDTLLQNKQLFSDISSLGRKYWAYITAAFVIILIASFFRYETEQVGGRLVRYDRLTSRVEWKSVFSKDDKWFSLRYNNLQQAKAIFQRRDMEAAAEKAATQAEDYSEELAKMNRNIEEQNKEIKEQRDELERQRWQRR